MRGRLARENLASSLVCGSVGQGHVVDCGRLPLRGGAVEQPALRTGADTRCRAAVAPLRLTAGTVALARSAGDCSHVLHFSRVCCLWEARVVKRRLGKTDFEVTTIGLGTWAIGGRQWGPQDDEASIGAIRAAMDHGINWVDTAPIYGAGHSEEVVGRALKALPASHRPLVFTKFGLGVNVDAPERSAREKDVLAE